MRITVPALALVLLTAACGGSDGYGSAPPSPGPVATTAVSLQNSAFSPSAISVPASATVTFTNLDGIEHNLTFSNAAVTSVGNFATGARQVAMPAAPGTYSYRCTLHAGMSGTVQVE